MRILVSWKGGSKLVIPVANPNDKVSSLFNLITTRVKAGSGDFPPDNRFVRLELDSFILNPDDFIKDVIESGDRLVAVDYFSDIEQVKGQCRDYWLTAHGVDFSDDSQKWVSVGFNKQQNRLFLMLGSAYNVTSKLELFSKDELTNMPKPGKHLAASLEGKNWFVQAHFVVEGNTVVAVELSAKSATYPQALIKRIEINVGETIKAGASSLVQDYFVYVNKDYVLPENTSSGNVLPEDKPAAPVTAGKPENTSQGDAPLEMRQLNDAYLEQYFGSSTGNQHVFTEFLITDKEPTAAVRKCILKFESEYWLNGEWKTLEYTTTGVREGPNNYNCRTAADRLIAVESANFKIALRASIPIAGPHCTNHRGRVYPTLPRPLKVRYTLYTTDNKSTSIVVEANNQPLDLETKTSWQKSSGHTAIVWAQCDDTAMENRFYVSGFENKKEHRIEVSNKAACRIMHLTRKSLLSYGYKAASEGKTEVELEDIAYNHSGIVIKLSLLVDKASAIAYGLKVHMETTTSKSTSHFLLPMPESVDSD